MLPDRFKNRSVTYGSQAILSLLFFAGIIVFLLLIAERHPLRWDATKDKKHTLSEESRKILANIKEPVHIKGFFADDESKSNAQDVFETYRYYSKHISYEFVDPDRNPELAKKYEVKTYGTSVIEGYGRKETLQRVSEESITNALMKLTRKDQKKVYFLEGHGERDINDLEKEGYSSLKSSLERLNYSLNKLNLMTTKDIPKDCSVLIIGGPKKKLLPEEIETLKTYLARGGRLTIMLDPYEEGGLKDFLQTYGFDLKNDMVIDKLSRVFGGSYLMPVVTQYGLHPITRDFRVTTFFPEARSIGEAAKKPDDISFTALAMTSENAWGETNKKLLDQGQAVYEEKEDVKGPVTIAALSEITIKEEGKADKKAFVALFGDSDFVSNTYFDLSGNGDLLINTINYLAEEESLITIEPRSKDGEALVLTENQMRLILLGSLLGAPLVVIIIAFCVYRVRRSQR